jgi:D-alanyl-D-alanine carboxypeptidase
MLPSGNDAACVLAFYYGSWLVAKKNFLGHQKSLTKEKLGDKDKYYQLYTKKFIQFVNTFIVRQELQHSNTHFENCHGLPDKAQVSTAWELAEASLKFLKNPVLHRLFSCFGRSAVVGFIEETIMKVILRLNGRTLTVF